MKVDLESLKDQYQKNKISNFSICLPSIALIAMNLGLNPLTPPSRRGATLRCVPPVAILSPRVLNVAVGKMISATRID